MPDPAPDAARLFDIAADLVVNDGLEAVTFRELARRSGVSEESIQDRFVSVEHVLVSMLDKEYADLYRGIVDHIDRDPRGGLLSRIYFYTLTGVYERPLARALYVTDPAALNRIMRTVHGMQYQPTTGIRSGFVDTMRELGLVKDVDAHTVSAMLSVFSAGLAITSPNEDFDLAVKGMEYVLSQLVDADVEDTLPGKLAFYEYANNLAGSSSEA